MTRTGAAVAKDAVTVTVRVSLFQQQRHHTSHDLAGKVGRPRVAPVRCGRSPKPQRWGAYSFDELVADLAAVIERYASPGGSTVLVAHSAGCSLAIAVAAASLTASSAEQGDTALLYYSTIHLSTLLPYSTILCYYYTMSTSYYATVLLHDYTRGALPAG